MPTISALGFADSFADVADGLTLLPVHECDETTARETTTLADGSLALRCSVFGVLCSLCVWHVWDEGREPSAGLALDAIAENFSISIPTLQTLGEHVVRVRRCENKSGQAKGGSLNVTTVLGVPSKHFATRHDLSKAHGAPGEPV